MNEIRAKIEGLLRSTERAGVEFMITYLGESGFSKPPAAPSTIWRVKEDWLGTV